MNKKTEQPGYIAVFITVKEAEEARKIAKSLVKRRLAACVNILPGIESHFWWEDKLDSAQEIQLIVKTRETLLPEIVKSVKKLHSYRVPEIIALPITGGSSDYLEWMDGEII